MHTLFHGWIALDKPFGLNSTKAVAIVKRLFKADKCGHGGTLDPLASGLLPIALGEATKTVQWAMEGAKSYRFEVTWGEERTTDDLEGTVSATSDMRPTAEAIAAILPQFTGAISQTPPIFSALKVHGERAYDLARAGQIPELKARLVEISRLELLSATPASAEFQTDCGKGTYIRALARDMGRALGCLGHVSMLRRVKVGPLTEADMIPLDKLDEMCHQSPGDIAKHRVLRPIETVLDGIPALAIGVEQAQRLRQGQPVLLRGANAPIAVDAVLITQGGSPVGIGSIEQGSLKPKRLFNL